MLTTRITTLCSLATSASEWRRLAGGIPFRQWEWLGTWWDHYEPAMRAMGRQVELYTLCVTDGDQLVGIAPWYLDRSRTGGAVIRFLGSGEVCSDYLGILCRPECRAEVVSSLANWLMSAARERTITTDRWDLLELDYADAQDDAIRQLVDELQAQGAGVHRDNAVSTWRIELPASLDEYLGRLSKSHRKQMRKLQRLYFDSGRAVLRTVDQAGQIDYGWQVLIQLHQRRLESKGQSGCFVSETFTSFHRAATEALFAAGLLRLLWLELDGHPVAAEYQLAGDQVTYAYQGGIDPRALACEPGRLITLATLERAIAAGQSAFDFCRGDEPYKAHFRAQPRELVTWLISSDRPTARLRQRLWIAQANARHWVKQNLQLPWGRNL